MSEAPHGTAPALEGKDIANPMGMILAGAAVLHYAGEAGVEGAQRCSRGRLRGGVRDGRAPGSERPDLKGTRARPSSPTR